MKAIPIKLERVSKNQPKIVEWQLGNTCNYNCEFCDYDVKSGSLPWVNIDTAKKVCQSLIDATPDKKIRFLFTGGEPTLYRDLVTLLKFIHDQGHLTSIHSNGSRTLRYWQDIADQKILDVLILSLHLHQGASIQHFKDIVSIFSSTKTIVTISISSTIEFFDECLSAIDEFRSFDVIVGMRGINFGQSLINYSENQLKILRENSHVVGNRFNISKNPMIKENNKLLVTLSDHSKIMLKPKQLQIRPEFNNFNGWECSIGQNYLNIKYDKVYRGMCQVGGVINTIDNDIIWKTDNVICDKKQCGCAFDLLQPKNISNQPKNDPMI